MGERKCAKRLEVSGAVLALVDEGSKVPALPQNDVRGFEQEFIFLDRLLSAPLDNGRWLLEKAFPFLF
jgi:hypothetical protein